MIEVGKGALREIDDIHLSRYACYLTAQNGDPKKKPVAFAQTYFAIQTRRQEIIDDEAVQYAPLSEDQKRVLLREEIKSHNKNLASAAKGAGVIEPIDYAIFQTYGYKGLYGGTVRKAIAEIGGTMPENLPAAEDITRVARRIKKGITSDTKKLK
jgi:DNA-damage-inducible protein D